MFKKATSLLTLAAVVLASVSCTTMTTKPVVTPSDLPGKAAMIQSVIMTSGEHVEFSPSDPGRVRGDVIVGTAAVRYKAPVEIQGPFSSIKRRPDGSVYEITDGTGRVHPVVGVAKEGETAWTILVNDRTARPVSIPLTDVRQIRFRKINAFLTALTIASVAGLFFIAWSVYTLSVI